MKKIVLIMMFLVTSVFAEGINWAKNYGEPVVKDYAFEGTAASKKDYEKLIETATKKNQPILFVISRDTCKYCVKLKDTTFQNKKVIEMLNKDFITATAWANEKDFIPELLVRYTPGLPGIWFLKPDGEPMYQAELGYRDSVQFLEMLKIVKKDFNTKK